ncbi:Sec-independent protein translocase subunit TatA [Nocardioides mangrovicus]|uniref:Sec-independent protein translocase subunit TatA n=1 Tax=Nocardioides mangrovicus TaxID=2478913 RepID=UPI0038CD7254
MNPLLAGLGTQEIVIILVVVILLFGAKKLPELARGSGQALRIFKAETKGLMEEDEKKESTKTEAQRELEAKQAELRLAQEKVAREAQEQEPRSNPNA